MQINYIYRLISLLELEERKQVYRSVTSRGVNVPGFKDINKVPLPILKNILKNKNKNKDYYGILFLKAIVSMNTSAEQIGENVNHDTITPQKIARIILNNEDFEQEKINDMLVELERVRAVESVGDNNHSDSLAEIKDKNNDLLNNELNLKVSQEIEELKVKNSILQSKVKDLRLQQEDTNKNLKMLQKENRNLLNKNNEYTMEKENYINHISSLKNEIASKDSKILYLTREIDKYIETVNQLTENINSYEQEINLLNIMSMNKNRILCFAKQAPTIQFIGMDIEIKNDWDKESLRKVDWFQYSKVWIITQDVPYYNVRHIENECKIEIEKYYSFKLINTRMEI